MSSLSIDTSDIPPESVFSPSFASISSETRFQNSSLSPVVHGIYSASPGFLSLPWISYSFKDTDEIKIRGKWTIEEDNILRAAVVQHGGKNWKKISENLSGRSDVQCLHRWQKVLKPGLIKGPWTKEVGYFCGKSPY